MKAFRKEVLLLEERKIVELFLSRDENAIPEAEKKFGKYCFKIANNILGNEEDAEECLSDALLAVWNSVPPQKPEFFSAFIGKITRNIALERLRKERAEKRGGGETAAVFDELSEFVSGKENIEENFERREILSAINGFLAGLPEEKRKIFVLRYFCFESSAEIAKRFGKSENGIRNLLARIRKNLKKYLDERGFEI